MAKRSTKKGMHRVQLNMTTSALGELDEHCREGGFSSRAAELRFGDEVVGRIIGHLKRGCEIVARDKQRKETVLVFMFPFGGGI